MKKLIVASLLTSVAMGGSAFAQTSAPDATATDPAMQTEGTTPPADQAQPGMEAETPEAGAMGSMPNEGGFITYQEGTQMLGSGLMGADVRGTDNESIGSVDDLLLDSQGQVQAIIVGVGGFLGVGTKDVAIATDQLEFVMADDAAADAPMAPADGAAAPADGTTATAPADPAAPAMGTTGTMGTGTGAPGTAAGGEGGWGWSGAGIDHIMVNYTREQLEDAPEFESAE